MLRREIVQGNVVVGPHDRYENALGRRVSADVGHWKFDGRFRDVDDNGDIPIHIEDLENIKANDLRLAMRRAYRALGGTEDPDGPHYYLVPDIELVEPDAYDASEQLDEWSTSSGVSFRFDPPTGGLLMVLRTILSEWPEDEEIGFGVVDRIAPLLTRNRLSVIDAAEEGVGPRHWQVDLLLSFSSRGRNMATLARAGLDAIALIQATAGHMTRQNVLDLLRGGNINALIGQPEGQWLDAKRQYFDVGSREKATDLKPPERREIEKLKLARSVAQFANAPEGGVVILGLVADGPSGFDVIKAVMPRAHAEKQRPVLLKQYRQALQEKLFPMPVHLRIELVPVDGGDLMLIDIPPQPEEIKPFLVRGAVINGQLDNTYISIFERAGEEGFAASVETIHSMLAAGRALLRHGHLPDRGRHEAPGGQTTSPR